MKTILALTVTQIKLLYNDKMNLFWFLAFPLLFILLFGYIVPNVGYKNDIMILAEDYSKSQILVDQLLTFPNSTLHNYDSLPESFEQFENGSFSVLITLNNESIDIHYSADEEAWIQNIKNAISPMVSEGTINTYSYENIYIIEPVDFILPGMIALTIMQIGLFGGTSLLNDRSKQILRRFKLNGIKPWQIILTHIISRLILVLCSSIVIVLFGKIILKIPLQLEYWYLQLFFIILGGVTFLSLGLFIASVLRSPEAGNIISQSLNFLLAFICGIFLPLSILPNAVQGIVSMIPLTPLVEILRNLFLDVNMDLITMLIGASVISLWACVSFCISSLLFKWE